jgi:hypothetical protein
MVLSLADTARWFQTISYYSSVEQRSRGQALHRFVYGVSKTEIIARIKQMTEGRALDLDSTFFLAEADSVKRAVYTASTLYLTEPERLWELDGRQLDPADEADGQLLKQIDDWLDKLNWHAVVRAAEILANLHGSVVVHPTVHLRARKPRLAVVPRYSIEAMPDADAPEDFELAEAVLLWVGVGSSSDQYIVAYHGSQISYLDQTGGILKEAKGPTSNPYGDWYPFVLLRINEPSGYPFPPIPDALYENHVTINAFLADLLATIQFQGFGQPWCTGLSPDNKIEALGPRHVINFEDPTSQMSFATPSPIFKDAMDVVRKIAKICAQMSNLSPNIWEDVAVERTGDAIMASRADIEMERQRQARIWRTFEPHLWEALQRVLDTYSEQLDTDWEIPAGLKLMRVCYQPPAYPGLNPQARAQADSTDLQSKAKTLPEVLMERQGLDQQTAEQRAEERTNSASASTAAAADSPSGPDSQPGPDLQTPMVPAITAGAPTIMQMEGSNAA